MSRSQRFSALLVVAVAILGAAYTLISGNKPLLGLDLQGGVSVVLQPTAPASDEALDQSVEILRARVDALGVAEPEISRQGNTILVNLPGAKEQKRALALVGETAELRFRPVLFDLSALGAATATNPSDATGSTDTTAGGSDTTTGITAGGSDTTTGGASTGITVGGADTTAPAAATSDSQQSLGFTGRFGAALPVQSPTTGTSATSGSTATTAAAGSGTTGADGATSTTLPAEQSTLDPSQIEALQACSTGTATAPENDKADAAVLLSDKTTGSLLCLGPTLLTGEALETAGATLDTTGQWIVNPVFKSGADGIDAFNAAAAKCYVESPDPVLCPTGQLAIVLDHEVISAPRINSANFSRDQIQISGSFDKASAQDLASVLRFGALPVELKTQQVQTVSATIGSDVLKAGLISGLLGLGLVAIYLLVYYRLAALVTIIGLGLSAVMLWSIIAWFGAKLGLALTLGGVVGLIVSIGVAGDSSIVYFENVKEMHQSGRKLTTSVERAYKGAFSTVIKADIVSLIAAGLLYWLTVGAVRGFAFYLGLATIFDLINAWLFMRPALAWLARRKGMAERPEALLGIRSGVAS